ncbi:hypothetical protein FALBO_2934 [Fusarium albosuccineum]|uniref:DUF7580 domain-containing protein n=1 Tax=Fusarium albosuccineum TaxID=1237068 RepID=A0A8H4PC56_9HYPO|nr:hypothetical protein FALBO_2934 [Fusarium albosuccineum]
MDSLSFAIQASDRLRAVANSLCTDHSCVQFCASLQVILGDIAQWLRTLPPDQYSEGEASALLRQLEDLCWTSPEKTHISPSDADLRVAGEEPPDYGKEIVSLHKALFTHCFCNESEKVLARIRLHNSTQDDSKVTFGVFFKAHPHHDGASFGCQPWCQDTHISVQRALNFEGDTRAECEEIRLDSDTPFCSYISAQDETGLILLYFLVMGQRLYFEESQEPSRQWQLDRPSISLSRLLEEVSASNSDFTEKRKEVLSWLLAKAVWQYYASPWMHQPWDKESVHFLSERRKTDEGHITGIYVNEPLLSVSIIPNQGEIKKDQGGRGQETRHIPYRGQCRSPFLVRPLHPVPKILALGIMLIEIQLGRRIESLYGEDEWPKYCPRGNPNQNTNYKICRDLIAKPAFFEDMADPLEALIRNCIQPNEVFVPPQVRDDQGIREALYSLVHRLEIYLSKRKPNNVKPLGLLGTPTSQPPPPSTFSSATAQPRPFHTQAAPRRNLQAQHDVVSENPFLQG